MDNFVAVAVAVAVAEPLITVFTLAYRFITKTQTVLQYFLTIINRVVCRQTLSFPFLGFPFLFIPFLQFRVSTCAKFVVH